ncbi:MAG: hypothetical protein DYG94_07320 [Leptolyngbya sp. PLA3]|nr:MAG: hypothetical protein EDM82_06665 [Cyanobacteria bacterium CYA]MCE7968539.1 hypothetical protein [Leptolyngbya sp. PL-A3]
MRSAAARVGVGLLLLVLAGTAAWMWLSGGGRGPGGAASRDFPDGIRMLCADEKCATVFNTTIAEIARVRELDEGAPIPCPTCAGPSLRARECPSCKGAFDERLARSVQGPAACPLCKKPLPKLTGG